MAFENGNPDLPAVQPLTTPVALDRMAIAETFPMLAGDPEGLQPGEPVTFLSLGEVDGWPVAHFLGPHGEITFML